MIVAKNLAKQYIIKEGSIFKKKKCKIVNAVKNVSIEIKEGQIVGLLGMNGAGKTTTIKMLSTIIAPNSGQLTIDGEDAIKNYNSVRRKLNVISGGERSLYWRLTAKENLEYFGVLYEVEKNILKEKIDRVIKMVGLEEFKNIPVERYSKGMKQRLQIARGLINDPKYIFMDEPTLGIDINYAKEIREYIRNISAEEKKGILLTTHYINEAEELCDYIYIINSGEIVTQGSPAELKSSFSDCFDSQIVIESDSPIVEAKYKEMFKKQRATVELTDKNELTVKFNSMKTSTGAIFRLIENENLKVKDINKFEPKLEDVLLNIIQQEGEK